LLPRDITAPSTNNQLVSIIYLSPVANLFLKFMTLKKVYKMRDNLKVSYLTAIFFFIVAIIYANLA
ncbi:hypothetical protein LMB75_02000, partial [Limosilactobacillus reuteri]